MFVFESRREGERKKCEGEKTGRKRGRELNLCTPWPYALLSSISSTLPLLQRYGGLTCGALADESVDLVDALAVVQAGAAGTLVRIDLAELPLVAWPISE